MRTTEVRKAIAVLKTEIQCIENSACCRTECYNCSLVLPKEDVLEAYKAAIKALEKQIEILE